MQESQKLHWENVYETKNANEVSWTQLIPQTSLNLIRSCNLPKTASIIDVGGGDSQLVDYLLEEGFTNITVLDISEKALNKAKQRLGDRAAHVNWIVSDVTSFEPQSPFDVWHDRAAFHFLTSEEQIEKYVSIVKRAVKEYMIIATFSEQGPKKCSGLDIQQYSEEKIDDLFKNEFVKVKCFTEDHVTPFNTKQNFLFCIFKKK